MKNLSIGLLLVGLLTTACGSANKTQGGEGDTARNASADTPSQILSPTEMDLVLKLNNHSIQTIAVWLSDFARTHKMTSAELSLELDSRFEINCSDVCEVKQKGNSNENNQ